MEWPVILNLNDTIRAYQHVLFVQRLMWLDHDQASPLRRAFNDVLRPWRDSRGLSHLHFGGNSLPFLINLALSWD